MSRTLTQPVGTLRPGTASTVATTLLGVAQQRLQAVPIHAPNHELRDLDQQLCDIIQNLLFATAGPLHDQIFGVFAEAGVIELSARFHKSKGFDKKALGKAIERFVECWGELPNDGIKLPPSRPTVFLVRRTDLCEAHLNTETQEGVIDSEQERQKPSTFKLSVAELVNCIRRGDYSPEELAAMSKAIESRAFTQQDSLAPKPVGHVCQDLIHCINSHNLSHEELGDIADTALRKIVSGSTIAESLKIETVSDATAEVKEFLQRCKAYKRLERASATSDPVVVAFLTSLRDEFRVLVSKLEGLETSKVSQKQTIVREVNHAKRILKVEFLWKGDTVGLAATPTDKSKAGYWRPRLAGKSTDLAAFPKFQVQLKKKT